MQLLRFHVHGLNKPALRLDALGPASGLPVEQPDMTAARNNTAPHRLNVWMNMLAGPTVMLLLVL